MNLSVLTLITGWQRGCPGAVCITGDDAAAVHGIARVALKRHYISIRVLSAKAR